MDKLLFGSLNHDKADLGIPKGRLWVYDLATPSGERFGGATFTADMLPFPCVPVYQYYLERAEIRVLAGQMFETSDDAYVSTVVNKTYSDLLALCIPLTPSNVIMYLTILFKEGDFRPLNRVQIVDRYINELLSSPSDLYSSSFNYKNRLDVVSSFVHYLYDSNLSSFIERDWYDFCGRYKSSSLIEFDEGVLFEELCRTRILIREGGGVYFKYRFFFAFFLGKYVSGRPAILENFLQNERYLGVPHLVEVIAGLSSDNSALVQELVEKLEAQLAFFSENYAPVEFDPFSAIEWPEHAREDELVWEPIAKQLEAGPRNANEIDVLKSSLLAEKRTENQQVVLRRFDHAEQRLGVFKNELEDALKNSDSLDGEMKIRAVNAILRAYLAFYQIGILISPALAERRYFMWYGLLFINYLQFSEKDGKERRAIMIMLCMISAIAGRAAEDLGTRKLGPVFKALKKSDLNGFQRLLQFELILMAKPDKWFETLALLWQIFEGSDVLGFPRRVLRDSWVVGITEGRPWMRRGSPISSGGSPLFSALFDTRRGHGCARFMLRG